jgi:hypothetical protein
VGVAWETERSKLLPRLNTTKYKYIKYSSRHAKIQQLEETKSRKNLENILNRKRNQHFDKNRISRIINILKKN